MNPGDYVLWRYVQRGGYGFFTDVPARVMRVNGATVRIAALKRDGSMVERNVKLCNLRSYSAEKFMACMNGIRQEKP